MGEDAKALASLEDNYLPVGCDFFYARETGRLVVQENLAEEFKQRFNAAIQLGARDYRTLLNAIITAAQIRGYKIEPERCQYMMFSRLLEKISEIVINGNSERDRTLGGMTAHATILYCDVFVDAILSCPKTEQNIY